MVRLEGLYAMKRSHEPWGSWACCPISWGWFLKVDEIILTDKELADLKMLGLLAFADLYLLTKDSDSGWPLWK